MLIEATFDKINNIFFKEFTQGLLKWQWM